MAVGGSGEEGELDDNDDDGVRHWLGLNETVFLPLRAASGRLLREHTLLPPWIRRVRRVRRMRRRPPTPPGDAVRPSLAGRALPSARPPPSPPPAGGGGETDGGEIGLRTGDRDR